MKKKRAKFSVGDTVRIFQERGTFHRGYMEDFTKEFFTISKVLKNLPIPTYKLKEFNGDELVGSFFEDELVRYKTPVFYQIDIIKTRGKGKKKEYLVHYRRWPKSYNKWKKLSDMKQL